MVSLHELAHAGLNESAAWGHILQAIMLLAQFGKHPDQHRTVLADLVPRCRRMYEGYATQISIANVLRMRTAPGLPEITAAYPDYEQYLDDAARAGPAIGFGLRWRQVASNASLLTCMQTDVLTPLMRVGPAAFVPAALRERDSPDFRLAVPQRRGPRLWAAVERTAAAVFGRRWADLREIDCGDPRAFHDADVWERLSQLCQAAAGNALEDEGLPTLDPRQVHAARPELIEAVRHAIGPGSEPIVLDDELSSLFEAERVRLRAPLPARVRDLSAATAADLTAGPGVLVTVRRPATLRRQLDLRDDPWPSERTEPVVTVPTRRAGEIDLHTLTRPDDLAAVRPPGRALLVSIALTCARDAGWAGRWSAAFIDADLVTILLDTPVGQSLGASLTEQADFRFAIVPAGSPEAGIAVLACSVGSYPPYLRPCTRAAAAGFRILWVPESCDVMRPADTRFRCRTLRLRRFHFGREGPALGCPAQTMRQETDDDRRRADSSRPDRLGVGVPRSPRASDRSSSAVPSSGHTVRGRPHRRVEGSGRARRDGGGQPERRGADGARDRDVPAGRPAVRGCRRRSLG